MRDCKHGNLARACELCENYARIAALESALKVAEEALVIHRDIMVQAPTAEDDPDFVLEKTKSALAAIKEARHEG